MWLFLPFGKTCIAYCTFNQRPKLTFSTHARSTAWLECVKDNQDLYNKRNEMEIAERSGTIWTLRKLINILHLRPTAHSVTNFVSLCSGTERFHSWTHSASLFRFCLRFIWKKRAQRIHLHGFWPFDCTGVQAQTVCLIRWQTRCCQKCVRCLPSLYLCVTAEVARVHKRHKLPCLWKDTQKKVVCSVCV